MSDQEVITDSSQIQALMSGNVPKMAQYMKFMGILQIIGGAVYCITIIGALIGVPVIYMGIRLREAAEGFKKYIASDSKQDLSYAIDRQTRSYFIQFILAIVSLALLVIYIVILIALLAAGRF
jgi:Family of unknown function (DUF5362)